MNRCSIIFAIILPLYVATAAADDIFEPFVTSNMSPFAQTHGIPTARSADTLKKGSKSLRLTSEIANNFTRNTSANESISIDGETWRNSLNIGFGLTDDWQLNLVIPYIRHDGGSFDSFIEDWHKVFGLPDGNRDEVARDLLTYRWTRAGTNQVNLTNSRSGIGDISIQIAHNLRHNEKRDLTVVGGVKLDTGDADDLLGSDSTNVYAGVYLTQRDFFGKPELTFHGSAGAMLIGDSDLPDTNDWLGYGSATIVWQAWQRVALKTQLDLNSAIYDSSLKELGDTSVQLTVGGTIALTEKTYLDIGVVEDVVTDTSPDVVFHMSLHRQF